jgi:tripartite-type tricarboxylate transporter receptor subunit TctC
MTGDILVSQILRVFLWCCLVATAGTSLAQGSFPSRPIRLVVPFVAGGTSDILARIIGQGISDELGQPVIVDNRPGAGGNIGSDFVAKSAPDGHTLVLASVGTHAINASLYKKMPYDPLKDFTPVALFATVPTVLVVNPNVKVDSARELIALAKARPGQLNYASAGIGTTQHLAGEMLKESAGVEVVHVPYKGGGQAVADLLAGQVAFMFPNIPVVHAHVKSGKLKALAVASTKRSPALPQIPTMAEATGLKDFDVSTWFGILGPAGLPAGTARKLNRAVNKVIATETVKAKLEAQGATGLESTPQSFGGFMAQEVDKWARVVKRAGIEAE